MTTSRWNLDLTHSGIHFSVRHMVIAKVRGRFSDWRGTLELDPNDLSKTKVEVEIDIASIDTGVADRDGHLRSADFFDAETYPKARFVGERMEAVGDDWKLHGQLTVRDVTRDVALDVEYLGSSKDPWGNTRAAFGAKVSIDRTDYGLKWNQALEAGGVLVGERVDLEIEIQAVATGEAA
ncbi:MAG: YceI family protein [Myxococcales bacterium]|nr:YceI family protein [Myxococcales bacterium]